jgi:hypothetical protein
VANARAKVGVIMREVASRTAAEGKGTAMGEGGSAVKIGAPDWEVEVTKERTKASPSSGSFR